MIDIAVIAPGQQAHDNVYRIGGHLPIGGELAPGNGDHSIGFGNVVSARQVCGTGRGRAGDQGSKPGPSSNHIGF